MQQLWLDAHLSPSLCTWLGELLAVEVRHLSELGLRHAHDTHIFAVARRQNVLLMTKDADFLLLVNQSGPPPRVLWINCGNTSNSKPAQPAYASPSSTATVAA